MYITNESGDLVQFNLFERDNQMNRKLSTNAFDDVSPY